MAAWSVPTTLVSPLALVARTAEVPSMNFDPFFTGASRGLLSYWDSDVNDQRTVWIVWSALQNRYITDSGFYEDILSAAEEEVLRTSVVVNPTGTQRNWAFGTQMNSLRGRWRRAFVGDVLTGSIQTNADFTYHSPTGGDLDWYVGAAGNQLLQETAYIRHIVSPY